MTQTVQGGPSPFLRWAGSKRWLVRRVRSFLPVEFNDYYEPFLGSGAMFFDIGDGHAAYLSDTIAPLVSTYKAVRLQHERVHQIASSWATDSDTYYQIRAKRYVSEHYAAARFIYLNRLCFNGLYRENRAGHFNVPYGRPRSTNTITSLDQLAACAKRLESAETKVLDFEKATSRCKPGDLVYLDPPYVAGHRSNGFVDYNARIFDWRDQRRLADTVHDLDSRGVYVILTNADHESVRELYDGFTIVSVERYSSMSSRFTTRGHSAELIVLGRTVIAGRQ
jgi:DNA adenine methylase